MPDFTLPFVEAPRADPRTEFGSAEDCCQAAVRLIGSSERVLTMLTHSLDTALYHHPEVVSAVKRFVLRPRFTRVRVLLLSPERVAYQNHPFVDIARKLTSSIEIRNATAAFCEYPGAYLVADDHSSLVLPLRERWSGLYEPKNPMISLTMLRHFDTGWNECTMRRSILLAG